MRCFPPQFLLKLLVPVASAGCYDADRHAENASFDDEIQSVSVDVSSGDVTLRAGDVTGARVSARVEGDANHLGHSLSNGHLALFDDCNDDPCSVDIGATVPSGVPIELRTGSGDCTVDGLLGTLSIHTGSGDIRGWGVAGTDLTATTGSGDVSLDVPDMAERVRVRTGSGDVVLDVPSGSYDLRVDTGSGDERFHAVSNDASAPGALEVTTGSGDVTIRGH